jgi:heme A synthase
MPLHPRAFSVTVIWTLLLLLLGSVVHATESSLACPDWPTCFGTMTPEMTGGVFWEHLHRLVAGGLLLMFGLATWLARREAVDSPWVFKVALAGLGLLLIQSLFGGLTVLYRLPDLVSTTHLGLAFVFLALATVLASSTRQGPRGVMSEAHRLRVRALASLSAGLVLVQSVVGALVRHMDAGMACPDVPLCLGQVVPPLVNAPITAHFLHRVLAMGVATVVIGLAVWARRSGVGDPARRWLDRAAYLAVVQVGLGVASILTVLAVVPVALHTVFAAALLATLAHAATIAHHAPTARSEAHEPAPAAA